MITVFHVIDWLNYFEEKEILLTPPSDELWDQIIVNLKKSRKKGTKKKAKNKKKAKKRAMHAKKEAEELVLDLITICQHSNHRDESAEACFYCGIAYLVLNREDESITLFRKAVSGFQTDRHKRAVARWALGNVMLIMKSQRDYGIVHWKKCLNTYRDLKLDHNFEKQQFDWYEARILEMEKSLMAVTNLSRKKINEILRDEEKRWLA